MTNEEKKPATPEKESEKLTTEREEIEVKDSTDTQPEKTEKADDERELIKAEEQAGENVTEKVDAIEAEEETEEPSSKTSGDDPSEDAPEKDDQQSSEKADEEKEPVKAEEKAVEDVTETADEEEAKEITEVADEESTKEVVEVTDEETAEEQDTTKESEDDEDGTDPAEKYYAQLAEKAETLLKLADWSLATMEFENINHLWKQGPDPEGTDIQQYREKIDQYRDQLEEKKREHYEMQQKIRQENLGKRKDLLNDFGKIIEEKKWTHTRDVARIRNKWDQVKPIPAENEEELEKAFTAFMKTFDEHKVDRLVKQKQQEEDNLTIKLVILEKLEKFLEGVDEESDWKELDKELSEFVKQFRKVGRIPSEKNQETWDRFYKAQDTFHSMRFKYDAGYRKEIEKNLSKKKKLIDEAEALIDTGDLAAAARKVNKLHRRWKKIGNLPQKDENELWDRFKSATDAFNEKKSENIDELREQEEENYNEKLKLIEKAKAIQDSEEWEETHKAYQQLMDQWKKTGPVSRRKSGKIWKKFKGAMDHFYDRRRDHFKEVKEERKDNLKDKEEVISKLNELGSHENPVEAVELAKPLQEEFKKAGYVPIKHKNRLWKEYREACDTIYERFRAAKSAVEIVGKENISQFSTDDLAEIKKKQDRVNKTYKQISKMSSDLIQMKESISYFKPSKGGSSILDDAKKRIEDTEKEIEKLEKQLQKDEMEIDKLKKGN